MMIAGFIAGLLIGFPIGYKVHQAYYRRLWSFYRALQKRMSGR